MSVVKIALTTDMVSRMHPRLFLKAHDYAWEKTCELFNRHDGYLGGFQLEVQSAIRDAYLMGKGIKTL